MTPQLPNPSLIPFLVAMTGHRDLRPQDLDLLRQEVRAIFSGMRRRMPNTPLILLTGLAEGADQLVAEVALEQNVLLAAAIPMPIDIYREQMTDEARKKFDGLLALSVLQIMMPPGRPDRPGASHKRSRPCGMLRSSRAIPLPLWAVAHRSVGWQHFARSAEEPPASFTMFVPARSTRVPTTPSCDAASSTRSSRQESIVRAGARDQDR